MSINRLSHTHSTMYEIYGKSGYSFSRSRAAATNSRAKGNSVARNEGVESGIFTIATREPQRTREKIPINKKKKEVLAGVSVVVEQPLDVQRAQLEYVARALRFSRRNSFFKWHITHTHINV